MFHCMEKHVHSILAKHFKKEKKEPNLTHCTSTNIKHSQNHTKHERQDPGCPALRTGVVG